MKNRQQDGRLCFRAYRETLEGVETQFALVRFVLKESKGRLIQQFYKDRLAARLAKMDDVFGKIRNRPGENPQEWDELHEDQREYALKKNKRESRPADNRFKIELSEDRLNQSELLLLVAHFESFMKEVHRTFLTAAPARVFGGSEAKVMLREVFDAQAGNPFGPFLKELIIKEVKWLDTQRIDKRADYFAKHYGVSLGSPREIETLKHLMVTRNKISHEIYAPPPRSPEDVREQPLVGDDMLKQARQLFRDIPRRCIEAGAKVYQSFFR
jgi:hypothetical protein